MNGPFIDIVELYDGATTRILRARDAHSSIPVVLKNIRPEHHTATEVLRLRHEYDILKLVEVPGVVRALDLAEHDGCPALVLADGGGRALDQVLANGPLDLSQALDLAAQIAAALENIHARRVIHKDINPNNIVVLEDAHAIELIDFELATTLPRVVEIDVRPDVLEGTLAYIAPEQTGRMNRSIDNRTDIYSFGATLYRMLTGNPPFVATDPLELVHAHIARRPMAPVQVNAAIPAAVSAIVMKLLAKMPEDRYQSAAGVRADLEECLDRLAADGSIAPFELATEDASDRFRIPERLYGRETELAQLDAIFCRAATGTAEFVLVKGPAGIGKSAVIREFARSVRSVAGSFASGQFLVGDRDVPYSGIAAALTSLVQELCAASEMQLAALRARLRAALGNAAGVVTDVIPSLCVVLGETPVDPVELPADQVRERAKFAFVQLFQVLAQEGLALFLDDIQWADAASLELLAHLVSDISGRGIVIIASEREEAEANPRMEHFVANLEKKGAALTTMTLGPLHHEAVRAVVFDAVDAQRGKISDAHIDALAHLVHRRTLGNPLFVATFLTMLHRDGCIDFDRAARAWRWNLEEIEKAAVPQDVAQLLSDRANKLDKNVLTILQAAACIGPEFDISLLRTVTERTLASVQQALVEAAQEGLIFATGHAYAFVHERVREAVLALMNPGNRKALHLRLGRELRPHARGDKLFAMLGHVNAAADLIERPDERLDMARDNLQAGQAARAKAAFEAALTYFEAGLSFLPPQAFDSARALAFELTHGAAEAAYSCNRRARATALYRDVDKHAKSEIERLRLAAARVRMHRVFNEFGVAKTLALEALDAHGISLPKKAGIPRVLLEFGKAERLMTSRSVNDLLAMPLAPSSERNDLLAALMEDALFVVYFEDPLLHSVMTSKIIVRTLKEGLSPVSPVCFAAYALLVRLIRGQAARADELCRMALRVCERFPGLPTALVRYMHAMLIMPFRHPFREAVAALGDVYKAASEEGSRVFMNLGLGPMVGYQFNTGLPIPEYLATFAARERELNELADATNNPRSHRVTYRIAHFLQGNTRPGTFETDHLDDATFIADLERDPMKLAAPLYDFNKAWANLILGRHAEAKQFFDRVPADIEQPLGAVYSIGEYLWLRGLVQATNMPANAIARARAIVAMRMDQRKLAGYAADSPKGFGHLAESLAAEIARIEGRTLAAADHYEKTVQLARAHGFLQYEAHALERAAQYWADRNNEEVFRSYMQRAHKAYQRWGATAKEAALEAAHPWLKRMQQRGSNATTITGTTGTKSTTSGSLDGQSMVLASQAVSEEIALDKLLHKLMTVAAQATGATREALVLDDKAGFVRVASFTVEAGANVLSTPEPIDSINDLPVSLLQYVLRTGKSILSDHAAEDESTRKDPCVRARNTKSLLIVPIVRHGTARGMLYLENDQIVGAFHAERLALCEVLVGQMSISIDNARLYAHLERLVEERTRALEKAQARVVELEKNATETRMAGGFAHEMRNVLTAAKMLLAAVHFTREGGEERSLCLENGEALFDLYHVLEQRIDPEVLDEIVPVLRQLNANEEKIHNVLGMVGAAIERALGTTGLIMDYAKLSNEVAGQSKFELSYLIEALRDESRADFEKHGISLDVTIPPNARLRGNDAHWYSILKNLVLNARDALLDVERPEGRKIRVTFEEHERELRLLVEDNGSGIDPNVASRMFEPFVSTKPDSGTGLGLGVVRKLVGLYQGTIHFETEIGRGTRFIVSLPREGIARSE